jgi:hypothetical protein
MPNEWVKEARVEDSSCDHGRADYEKRAGCDSTQELSSIVSAVSLFGSWDKKQIGSWELADRSRA